MGYKRNPSGYRILGEPQCAAPGEDKGKEFLYAGDTKD